MLSEEEKKRLRAEEVYREEVRKDLAGKRDSKLFTFFNSALGIWLLSTLVVGAISWGYATWNEDKVKIRQNDEIVRRLDVEIGGRIAFVELYISNLRDRLDRQGYDGEERNNFYLALGALEDPSIKNFHLVTFPEFNTRGLTSLLWELRSVVSPSERERIGYALVAARRLSTIQLSKLEDVQVNKLHDPRETERAMYELQGAFRHDQYRVIQIIEAVFHQPRWNMPGSQASPTTTESPEESAEESPEGNADESPTVSPEKTATPTPEKR